MNCKPGDLAIVVRSDAGNEGKIVRCVQLLGMYPVHGPNLVEETVPVWVIDRGLTAWDGTADHYIGDDQLRPIRDPGDDAKDEMLRPLPEEVAA